jgi:hypothetical protein
MVGISTKNLRINLNKDKELTCVLQTFRTLLFFFVLDKNPLISSPSLHSYSPTPPTRTTTRHIKSFVKESPVHGLMYLLPLVRSTSPVSKSLRRGGTDLSG